jgi:hypothetical protein
MEEYRKIEGYDNYSVSNKGNVRNDKTKRILKGTTNSDGYLQVVLYKERKAKSYKIHRLVGNAFIPNLDDYPQIDHINQKKDDNRIENLRWCSIANNLRNIKKREGTSSQFRGVYWNKRINNWKACISLDGKLKHLGYFEKEEEAYEAWRTCVIENNLQDFYCL